MDELINFIAEISGEDISQLHETDELSDDIGFDSLMIMDLVGSIKSEFNLKGTISLRDNYRRTLIIVEGVYSMDGDTCDLPKLIELKNKFACILMIDEAHSFGTIGARGGGSCDYYNIDSSNVDILMGTLSKFGASCGGYITGKKKFINWLKFNSPGFIFSAGITPANTASALKAIHIFKNDNSIVDKLRTNSNYLLDGIKHLGFDTGLSKDTPVIPIIIGESERAMMLSNELFKNGVNALPIIYPAAKESEARIRFFVSSQHTKDDLDKTLSILKKYAHLA